MKPLREEVLAADSSAERLAELVAHAAPFKPNPFRKRMVLQRLARAREVTPVRSARWLRPALGSLGVYLLGGVGVAAAAYGWFSSSRPEPTPRVISVAPAPRASDAPRLSPPLTAPAASDAVAPSESEVEAAPGKAHPAGTSAAREAKARSVDHGEDPTQVLEAIRALRKQGDAARAQVLLNQYMKSHPSGALTEDALVLSIEAANARHDPRAVDYAKRYLARFPNGRFRALAERVAERQ